MLSYLVGGTTFVRTKHDDIWGAVGELFGVKSLVVAQQLQVGTSTFQTILQFDLILDDEGLALVVDSLREFGRDGMVSSGVLENQALVANDSRKDLWLFDSPFTDIGPVLFALGVLLLGVGGCPSGVPIIGELF